MTPTDHRAITISLTKIEAATLLAWAKEGNEADENRLRDPNSPSPPVVPKPLRRKGLSAIDKLARAINDRK